MKLLLPLLLLSIVASSQQVTMSIVDNNPFNRGCSFPIKGVIDMSEESLRHSTTPQFFLATITRADHDLTIESAAEILRFHISKVVDHPEHYTTRMREGDDVFEVDSLIIDTKKPYSRTDSVMIYKDAYGNFHTGPFKHEAVFTRGTFKGIVIVNCQRQNMLILDTQTMNGRFYQ